MLMVLAKNLEKKVKTFQLERKMIEGPTSVDFRFQIRRFLLKSYSTRNKTQTPY